MGCCLSALWGAGRLLEPNPGCGLSSIQGFPSSPRSHPDIVSDIRAGSPQSLVLCQVVLEVLSLAALEIILDPGPSLSSSLFLVEKIAVSWCHAIGLSHERVCSAISVPHSTCSLCASVCPRGGFPGVHRPECCVSSIPTLQDSWTLLTVPVGCGGRPVRGPVLWTTDCPQVFTSVAGISAWALSHEFPLLGYLTASWSLPPRRPWP